jgi:hypothetical protein
MRALLGIATTAAATAQRLCARYARTSTGWVTEGERPQRGFAGVVRHLSPNAGPGNSPSSAAMVTRSGRERAFIFRITLPRCPFTVISLMSSSLPTCLLSVARDHERHDLPLARAELSIAPAQCQYFGFQTERGRASFHGAADLS